MQQQIVSVISALHNGHAMIKIEQNNTKLGCSHIFYSTPWEQIDV